MLNQGKISLNLLSREYQPHHENEMRKHVKLPVLAFLTGCRGCWRGRPAVQTLRATGCPLRGDPAEAAEAAAAAAASPVARSYVATNLPSASDGGAGER
jgi:hypothetical protein